MNLRLLLVVTLLALALPQAASAHHRSHWREGYASVLHPRHGKSARHYKPAIMPPNPIVYMEQLAPQWWGQAACNGSYAINYVPNNPEYPGPGPGTVMVAYSESPAYNPAYTSCSITFVNGNYANADEDYADWPTFCAVFLHEYGHLLGYQHVDTIGNIMYPDTASKEVPAACVKDPTGKVWTDYLADAHATRPS